MSFTWTLVGATGALAHVLAWSLAAAVFLVAPHRRVNRRLAFALTVDGLTLGMVAGYTYLTSDAVLAHTFRRAAWFAALVAPAAYLWFLSTLDTPLARWLRNRWVERAIGLGVAVMGVAVLLSPDLLTLGHASVGYAAHEFNWGGPAATLVFGAYSLAAWFGLVAAIDAWRRAAHGTVARARARGYTLAFGVRDAVFGVTLGAWALGWSLPDQGALGTVDLLATNVGWIAFAVLLTYAILRHQVLGIELHLKLALRQSTVVAFFVAVFFIVSELAAATLAPRVGTVAGVVAAGLLLFLLAPLQRLAERVGDRAMPTVEDTPAYRERRRAEIYAAAVESALEDGTITERERAVLATLQDQLGLGAREALDIERGLVRA